MTTGMRAGAAVLNDAPHRRLGSPVALLEVLLAADLAVAPHVAARLFAELDGDADAALEVVSLLTPGQRRGSRSLPNPLPLTSRIASEFEELRLHEWERQVLLAASVCIDDGTETLLAIAERTMGDLIASRVSELLSFVAGHFAFVDPRLRIWIHETADLGERTMVHARLSMICSERGDMSGALWHRSLSTMAGEPALTARLLTLAEHAMRSDQPAWAFDVAREAVGHAGPGELRSARTVAGVIALGNGFVEDACDLLDAVVADRGATAVGTAAFLVARALRSGSVPAPEALTLRPDDGDEQGWQNWGMLTTVLAILSSERGAEADARRWAAVAQEADAACGADAAFGSAATAWADLLTGRGGAVVSADADPVFRRTLVALERGLAGRAGDGIRLLATDECPERADPVTRGYRCSPVIRAYRAVTEALLRLWEGDIRAAREAIEQAALRLPLSQPLAGLAVVIARRVELCETGRTGALSASLASALPSGLHQDQLVERGLEAYLEGRVDEAATHIALWTERGWPGPAFGLPGLDEVGPVEHRGFVEPADAARARLLRAGIRATRAASWQSEHQSAAEASRSIRSPFERARVEALLGTTCLTRGDRGAALRHLRAARSLFAEAGAGAWEAAVATRLTRVGEQLAEASAPQTAPVRICSADPLAACRAAWEPVLTERELQVAMLVAEGSTNREIASRLHIAVRTVEVHIGRLFAKFDVRSRAELTVLAHRTNQFS